MAVPILQPLPGNTYSSGRPRRYFEIRVNESHFALPDAVDAKSAARSKTTVARPEYPHSAADGRQTTSGTEAAGMMNVVLMTRNTAGLPVVWYANGWIGTRSSRMRV